MALRGFPGNMEFEGRITICKLNLELYLKESHLCDCVEYSLSLEYSHLILWGLVVIVPKTIHVYGDDLAHEREISSVGQIQQAVSSKD